ncbi:MAG: helix-turn-helix domain-containing protein [Thermoplasmata archaeon]
MRVPRPIHLSSAEREQLSSWARTASNPRRGRRSQIILYASRGWTNCHIAERLQIHPETVALWRRRFSSNRLEGVRSDAPRSGHHAAARRRLERRILRATFQSTPPQGGAWTTRSLSRALQVSHMTVYRTWVAYGVGRGLRRPAAPSRTPRPVALEGVFLHPTRKAAVLRIEDAAAPTGVGDGPGAGVWEPLSALVAQWTPSKLDARESTHSATQLLVLLRMIERQSEGRGRFLVVHDVANSAAPDRVRQWIRSHPRFEAVGVRKGRSWAETMDRYVACGDPGREPEAAVSPVAESFSHFRSQDPSATVPFVWSPGDRVPPFSAT